jgi:SPP1 family predicted phage head-tail adaptor
MNIGRMRHKVTIQRPAQIPDNGGGYQDGWAAVATVWAEVTPLRGREFFQAQQTQTEITHKVRIRYRNVTNDSRLIFDKRVLNIKGTPINVNERNEVLEIHCVE